MSVLNRSGNKLIIFTCVTVFKFAVYFILKYALS